MREARIALAVARRVTDKDDPGPVVARAKEQIRPGTEHQVRPGRHAHARLGREEHAVNSGERIGFADSSSAEADVDGPDAGGQGGAMAGGVEQGEASGSRPAAWARSWTAGPAKE